MFWNLANIISVIRILLLPLFVGLLLSGNTGLMAAAVVLCPVIFLLDYVDGYVAQKFKLKTTIGSFIDTVADRITEVVMWILFVALDIIPFWAPMIILSRGMITDLIRAKAQSKGIGVYEMAKSDLAKFLVNSRFMRGMAVVKIALFVVSSAIVAFNDTSLIAYILPLTILCVIINIIRGIPVMWEGRSFFK